MDYVNMSIGEVLKQRRVDLSVKQEALAEKMGVTVQTVSKWERGLTEPKASQVSELAGILKLSEKEICQGKVADENIDQMTFLSHVETAMRMMPTTVFLVELYDFIENKSDFVNKISESAGIPTLNEQNKINAKYWLDMAQSGAIKFEDEVQKQLFIDCHKKALKE